MQKDTAKARRATAAMAMLSIAAPLFAGSTEPPMYMMTELGHLPGSSVGSVLVAISDPTPAGPVVVGQSFSAFTPPTLSWRATVWRPDVSLTPTDLLTIAQAGNSSVNRAQDVSPNGQYIVGYSNVGQPHGVRWSFDPVTGAVTNVQNLSALAGDGACEAVGVNSAGRAAGYSLTDSSSMRGTTWAPGSATAALLPNPPGSGGIRLAREISEPPMEHIVGRSDMGSVPTTRPVIWQKTDPNGRGDAYGVGSLMDHLFPTAVHDAVGITPDGLTAVGLGASATQAHGVSWSTQTHEVTEFSPICCVQNVIYDMNNDGVGVGYTAEGLEVFRAVLYWNGQAINLNDRVANNSAIGKSLFLHVATGINSAGQIVGKFGGFGSGEPLDPGRIFILTPVPGPEITGDLDGNDVVDGIDLGILLSQWFAPGSADFDDDGDVDGIDLGILLANWTT